MKYGIEVPVEDIEVSVLLVWVCCVVTTVLNDIGGIVEDIVEIIVGVSGTLVVTEIMECVLFFQIIIVDDDNHFYNYENGSRTLR